MLLCCFRVFEGEASGPLVSACRPTDPALTSCEEYAPQRDERKQEIPPYSHCEHALSAGNIPGIRIERGDGVVKQCDDQCRLSIWRLWIRVLGAHWFFDGYAQWNRPGEDCSKDC